MTDAGLSVGIEVSSSKVVVAGWQDGASQRLVEVSLPILYELKKDGHVRPASLKHWLSRQQFEFATGNGYVRVAADDFLRSILDRALKAASDVLGQPIKGVTASVAPSMGSRSRSMLRSILQDLGYESQLFNEDQAVIKAVPDLTRSDALVLLNIRYRSIEASLYVSSGTSLSLAALEVIEEAGLDWLDLDLYRHFFGNEKPGAPSLDKLDEMMAYVRRARENWTPGESLELDADSPPEFPHRKLAAETVTWIFKRNYQETLNLIKRIAGTANASPDVVVVSPPPPNPFLMDWIEEELSYSVRPLVRARILEGAAMQAWETGGRQKFQLPANTELPLVLSPKDFLEKKPAAPSRPPADGLGAGLPDTGQARTTEEALSNYLDAVVRIFGDLSTDEIMKMLPKVNYACEEMMAKFIDRAAKKMIAVSQYEEAFKIYKKYFHKNTGFNYLAGPAVGLCLGQAKHAYKHRENRVAQRWCNRGLEFSPRHEELLELKRIARY